MQHDEHVWTWYRHHRDIYLAQPLPVPEIARWTWWKISGHPTGPLDYRFWCFGGTVEMIQVDDNAHAMNAYYDRDWTRLSLRFRDRGVETDVDQPPNLEDMIRVASSLSRGIDFVRVDLYSVHGKTYAGEMTFMPTAGSFRFKPEYWEEYFGEKWVTDHCT